MKKIKIKGNSSSLAIFGWTLFVFGSIAFIISQSFFALILIIPGLFGVMYRKGIQIDEVSGKFRKYQTAWGFKTGEWQNLSKFNHIAITSRSRDKYGRIKESDRTYKIRLRNNTKNESVHISKLDTHADAMAEALAWSEIFVIPVKDFTLN